MIQVSFGQLKGTVTSTDGEPLSYVTIYSETATHGTLSNDEGYFELVVEDGTHHIIIEHLGYEEFNEVIELRGEKTLNIQLKSRGYELEELTISADAEDAAYPIMRKAIKKRKEHYDARQKYSVDIYTKGVAKVIDAPTSILGQDIGNMEGMLDSTRQGIIYTAESESSYYFHQPNLEKEIVKSSIVAEGDKMLNINRFLNLEYDIYKPSFDFNKTVLNPLANSAFAWYKYELLEMDIKPNGTEIYRIKVIPKNATRALMYGEIYIEGDTYKVSQVDLSIPGESVGQTIMKTINFKQVYHTGDATYAVPISQVTNLDAGMFGFKIKAAFTFVYNNYDFGAAQLNPSFFDSEVYRFDEDAIITDSIYWNKKRPIPLTEEERLNYIKKDSLKKIWESKEYMDSIDRKDNKFGLMNVFTGYTYERSYKHSKLTFLSPLSTTMFHPVMGFSVGINGKYQKRFGHKEKQYLKVDGAADYGFSDKKVRWNIGAYLNTNRNKRQVYMLRVGDEYRQFGFKDMTKYVHGNVQALIAKKHVIKLYRSRFAKIGLHRELRNGLSAKIFSEYARRSRLQNHAKYGFMNNEDPYKSNHPIENLDSDFFQSYDMWTTRLSFKYVPFQKYISYQGDKINLGNKWPTLDLSYNVGFGSDDRMLHTVQLAIIKDEINLNLLGKSYLKIGAGVFIAKKNLEFIDRFHFRTSNTLVTSADLYRSSFKRMPFYEYSTDRGYLLNIFEHRFNGFLLNTIPLVNKLGWGIVVGANTLIRQDASNYFETSVGLSNIHIFGMELFRVDYTFSFEDGRYIDSGFNLGMIIEL